MLKRLFILLTITTSLFCSYLTAEPLQSFDSKSPSSLNEHQPININKADVKTLSLLKGIGAKKAQSIISFRESYGAFKSVEDLLKIKGIGKKVVSDNRAFLVI